MQLFARLLARRGIWVFVLSGALLLPPATVSAGMAASRLQADLDGMPMELKDVADWYCDDFSFPAIHCFSDPFRLEARADFMAEAASVAYVTVYDYASFAGSYMHISEDYTVLALLGWNDRISSFIARNGEDGHFFKDWFYTGTTYYFCCSQQTPSLGAFDNTFSSVHRN